MGAFKPAGDLQRVQPIEVLSEGFAAFTGSAQSRESLRTRLRHVYDALQTVEQEQHRAFDRKK